MTDVTRKVLHPPDERSFIASSPYVVAELKMTEKANIQCDINHICNTNSNATPLASAQCRRGVLINMSTTKNANENNAA